MFENWRFNPFTGTMNAATITDEPHTIEYHADWNAYGIQLDEAPQLDNPSSVSIVEDVSGGDTFSEVPRTQAPEALQYRVDYDALTYYGTGRIEFNAADVGKTVLVSYKGTGWTLKNRYSAGQTVIPANLDVTEDASIDGDLTLTGDNTGKGNLNVAGDADITGALNVDGGITGDVTGDVTGNADTVTNGVYTTGDQTVNGVKTFGSTIVGSIDSIKETGSGAGTVRKKIIEIGDWNMDSTQQKYVAHGLTRTKIRSINIIIRGDSDGDYYPLNYTDITSGLTQGKWFLPVGSETFIEMQRLASGLFDSTSFDATSYNRGWVVIDYVD